MTLSIEVAVTRLSEAFTDLVKAAVAEAYGAIRATTTDPVPEDPKTPAPAQEAEKPVLEMLTVQKRLADLANLQGRQAVVDLITKVVGKETKFSNVSATFYPALYKAAQDAIDPPSSKVS